MKQIYGKLAGLIVLLISFPGYLLSQEEPITLDERINAWVEPATNLIESIVFFSISVPGTDISMPIVLLILILGAI